MAGLDKVIAAQAAYYGLTVYENAKRESALCKIQELAEFNQWESEK